jgi:hypothetical protein
MQHRAALEAAFYRVGDGRWTVEGKGVGGGV